MVFCTGKKKRLSPQTAKEFFSKEKNASEIQEKQNISKVKEPKDKLKLKSSPVIGDPTKGMQT